MEILISTSFSTPRSFQPIPWVILYTRPLGGPWHRELRRAWRQYCDEVAQVARDPKQFAIAALKIAETNHVVAEYIRKRVASRSSCKPRGIVRDSGLKEVLSVNLVSWAVRPEEAWRRRLLAIQEALWSCTRGWWRWRKASRT